MKISCCVALVLAFALALSGSLLAGEYREISGQRVLVGTPTEAGDWEGTWYYVNRNQKMAMWLRGSSKAPEIRLRYINLSSGESFETDWTGHAEYGHRSGRGEFACEINESDPNLLRGDWSWKFSDEFKERMEISKIEIYRSGDGRQITLIFEELTRVMRDTRELVARGPLVWTFMKASNRIALWDELPF